MRSLCLVLFSSLTLLVACLTFDESTDDGEMAVEVAAGELDDAQKSTEIKLEGEEEPYVPMTIISDWNMRRLDGMDENLQVLKVEGGENNGLCWRRTNLLGEDDVRFGRLLPDAEVDTAFLMGLLDDEFLVVTKRDGAYRFLYDGEEHIHRAPENKEVNFEDRLTFQITRDGVLTIRDSLLEGEDDIVFVYLSGKVFKYLARGDNFTWEIVWDDETSWTRECGYMRVSREVDEDGNILGFWITCNQWNEFLRAPGIRTQRGIR